MKNEHENDSSASLGSDAQVPAVTEAHPTIHPWAARRHVFQLGTSDDRVSKLEQEVKSLREELAKWKAAISDFLERVKS